MYESSLQARPAYLSARSLASRICSGRPDQIAEINLDHQALTSDWSRDPPSGTSMSAKRALTESRRRPYRDTTGRTRLAISAWFTAGSARVVRTFRSTLTIPFGHRISSLLRRCLQPAEIRPSQVGSIRLFSSKVATKSPLSHSKKPASVLAVETRAVVGTTPHG